MPATLATSIGNSSSVAESVGELIVSGVGSWRLATSLAGDGLAFCLVAFDPGVLSVALVAAELLFSSNRRSSDCNWEAVDFDWAVVPLLEVLETVGLTLLDPEEPAAEAVEAITNRGLFELPAVNWSVQSQVSFNRAKDQSSLAVPLAVIDSISAPSGQ